MYPQALQPRRSTAEMQAHGLPVLVSLEGGNTAALYSLTGRPSAGTPSAGGGLYPVEATMGSTTAFVPVTNPMYLLGGAGSGTAGHGGIGMAMLQGSPRFMSPFSAGRPLSSGSNVVLSGGGAAGAGAAGAEPRLQSRLSQEARAGGGRVSMEQQLQRTAGSPASGQHARHPHNA